MCQGQQKFFKRHMDCGICNSESCSSKDSKRFLLKNNSTNHFIIHYYNTRLSRNIKHIKDLYVDLSNSKIQINTSLETSEAEESILFEETKSICNRRDSIESTDSTEFDISNYSLKPFVDTRMHEPRRICPSSRPQNNWLKYFYGLCLIGSLYIIIVVLHNGEQIRKIVKEVKHLKQELNEDIDTETRIYKIETSLNNIKREQESLRKSLKSLVACELENFANDKTGKTDFALESSGGRIVRLSTDTENFNMAKTIFGVTLCEGMHGPRAMLQSDMSPGHCWAIKGSHGGAVIKLLGKVQITEVTIEHIPSTMSPTLEVTSAPKDCEIWGLKDSAQNGEYLGRFTYNINGPSVQTFQIENINYYEYVEFRVLTNHNNPDFTCVYRLRVHGVLEKEGK